ncbi:hypothetical protein NL676_028546 [Syzygium grande]|nr:hypothetical protein NL676_028546 [Syzygium grande]
MQLSLSSFFFSFLFFFSSSSLPFSSSSSSVRLLWLPACCLLPELVATDRPSSFASRRPHLDRATPPSSPVTACRRPARAAREQKLAVALVAARLHQAARQLVRPRPASRDAAVSPLTPLSRRPACPTSPHRPRRCGGGLRSPRDLPSAPALPLSPPPPQLPRPLLVLAELVIAATRRRCSPASQPELPSHSPVAQAAAPASAELAQAMARQPKPLPRPWPSLPRRLPHHARAVPAARPLARSLARPAICPHLAARPAVPSHCPCRGRVSRAVAESPRPCAEPWPTRAVAPLPAPSHRRSNPAISGHNQFFRAKLK